MKIDIKLTLELHAKWLRDEPDGKRADLSGAKLSGADLSGADLLGADLSGADLLGANLSRANLSRAKLSGADLSGADLSGADLSGADLDFSSWPLWCGSVGVKVDAKIASQLAAHFCAVECDDPAYKAAREAVLSFAATSHRAVECKVKAGAR